MNSCLYYDASDECYVKPDVIIGIMNERHHCFVSEMMERDILHETDPSLHYRLVSMMIISLVFP